MPGLAGILTKKPRQWAEPLVAQMVTALGHEAFYSSGLWTDASLGVYAGWTAIAGSFADGMPLTRQHLSLLFSGEEYSAAAADRVLSSSPLSPAAGLLGRAAAEPDFPLSLNGLFHGLLADCDAGTVRLFNDRYGMHRLYYYAEPDAFYFAAEAKAILAVRPDLREASEQGLGEFLALGCVLEDRTIFRRISVLPAGSCWMFRQGELASRARYFDPAAWEQQEPLDSETYWRALQAVLRDQLPRYFAGPQRTGIALTGGLDTRVLLAQYRPPAGDAPCYTFGGMFQDCQDVRLARRVAALCQQPHSVIPVADEYVRRFPEYAERSLYLSDGTVDVYRSSDLYVSERARSIAPAKVVGTYGSEIVRHAVMFKPMPLPYGLMNQAMLQPMRQATETYASVRRVHPVTFAAFRQSPWYHHGIVGLEQSQLTVRSPYLDNEFVRTVYRAPSSSDLSSDVRLQLIREGSPALAGVPSDRGLGGRHGLWGTLAHAWQEFTFKAEYAYDYGMPQPVAKIDHVLARLRLERLFLGRHKFLHYRLWYRDALAGYLREVLLDRRTRSRPYLNSRILEEIVTGHTRGDRNYTSTLHRMLSLELLQRLFFDPR